MTQIYHYNHCTEKGGRRQTYSSPAYNMMDIHIKQTLHKRRTGGRLSCSHPGLYSLQRCMCSRGHSTSTQSCVQNQLCVVLFHCESMFKNLYNILLKKCYRRKENLQFNSAHALEGNPLLEATSEKKC